MATNAELNDRVEKLESQVKKILNQQANPTTTVTPEPTVRPPAASAQDALAYARDGYAEDGVEQRWRGTHPGNLDEAAVEAGATPEGWASDLVYQEFILSNKIPTKNQRAAAVASGAGLSGTLTQWDALIAEGKAYSTQGWWGEVLRRRAASAGTPGGGASGGNT